MVLSACHFQFKIQYALWKKAKEKSLQDGKKKGGGGGEKES